MPLLLGYLIVGVVCAGICTTLARRKVVNVGPWAVYGLVFGVFAVAYLLWLPNIFTENADTAQRAPAERHGAAPGLRKGKKRTP